MRAVVLRRATIKNLNKEWTTFKLVRPPKEKKLPPILSLKEVRDILINTQMDYHRACLTTIYSLGLRLQEGTHQQVADIDAVPPRRDCPYSSRQR